MHPAYSIILFTTASGAGYGLLIWLALTALIHGPAANWWFAATSMTVAFALISSGLVSSTFHLGRPGRAWRAFSEWRSSWLSREAIASLVTLGPSLVLAVAWLDLLDAPWLIVPAAMATLLMGVITIFCTARIYSSLATIRQWHHPLVNAGYLALGIATGAVLIVSLANIFGLFAPVMGRLSALSLVAAAICKWFYWRAIDSAPRTYTIEQATGLGSLGKVRQWEPPHTGGNFIMREMGYKVARQHALKLRQYVLAALCMAAATTLASTLVSGGLSAALAATSIACAGLGVLIERWLFFAEAQHVSTLYYGTPRA
jgi:DMSO reductase anchor subunit